MTEQPQDYITDANEMLGAGYNDQPAAIIDKQRTVTALRDKGLIEYKVWGWVKMSAKFIAHIRKLKGAKLAVWNVIALTISESGKCELSVPEIAELAGYSTSETRTTISELEEMGYMAVARKSGMKSIYSPEFVARATANPTEQPLQETCTPPVCNHSYPTSPAIENPIPSIKRVKRVNTQTSKNEIASMGGIAWALAGGLEVTEEMAAEVRLRDAAPIAFEAALGFSRPLAWTADKDWLAFGAWVLAQYRVDAECFKRFENWRNTPYVKGSISNNRLRGFVNEFYDSWDMFKKTDRTQADAIPNITIGTR